MWRCDAPAVRRMARDGTHKTTRSDEQILPLRNGTIGAAHVRFLNCVATVWEEHLDSSEAVQVAARIAGNHGKPLVVIRALDVIGKPIREALPVLESFSHAEAEAELTAIVRRLVDVADLECRVCYTDVRDGMDCLATEFGSVLVIVNDGHAPHFVNEDLAGRPGSDCGVRLFAVRGHVSTEEVTSLPLERTEAPGATLL